MNIGLFGGTFNPLHNAHIEIIKYVSDKFDLKTIFFIPSAIPPHKVKKDVYIAHVPKINISSTIIRQLIKQGNSIKDLTPPMVTEQIYGKGLYL